MKRARHPEVSGLTPNEMTVSEHHVSPIKIKKFRHMKILITTLILTLISSSSFAQCLEGFCHNGYGKKRFAKCLYEGDFVDGHMEGYGFLTWDNGATYQGEFKYDKYHGQGKLRLPDGGIMEGKFEYGKLNGQGVLIQPNGKKYIGEVKDNILHGYGKMIDENGNLIFEGQFHEGNPIKN